jgi:hypothetical protein
MSRAPAVGRGRICRGDVRHSWKSVRSRRMTVAFLACEWTEATPGKQIQNPSNISMQYTL